MVQNIHKRMPVLSYLQTGQNHEARNPRNTLIFQSLSERIVSLTALKYFNAAFGH